MPVVFGVSRERRGVPPRWCSPDSFPEMLLPPRAFRALHLTARWWDRGTLAGHGARGADLLGTAALVLRHFVCCGQARAAQPGPRLEVPCPPCPHTAPGSAPKGCAACRGNLVAACRAAARGQCQQTPCCSCCLQLLGRKRKPVRLTVLCGLHNRLNSGDLSICSFL